MCKALFVVTKLDLFLWVDVMGALQKDTPFMKFIFQCIFRKLDDTKMAEKPWILNEQIE